MKEVLVEGSSRRGRLRGRIRYRSTCVKEVLVERRGRPLVRWRDRVKEYMCERGVSREERKAT